MPDSHTSTRSDAEELVSAAGRLALSLQPLLFEVAPGSNSYRGKLATSVKELLEWLSLLTTALEGPGPNDGPDLVEALQTPISIELLASLRRLTGEVETYHKRWMETRSAPNSPDRDTPMKQLHNRTISLTRLVEQCTERVEAVLMRLESDAELGPSERLQQALLTTRRTTREVQSSAAEVKQTQHDVAVAAGTVATDSLAVSFETYTTAQARSAQWWMVFSVTAVAGVVIVGILLLRTQVPSWQQTVAHLVIALPAAGVAAYGARESSRHRESSQWARRVSAQLKAIGPFTDRLPDEEQTVLWTTFGRYIFGPHAAEPAENQLQTVPPELLKAVTDLVKASK